MTQHPEKTPTTVVEKVAPLRSRAVKELSRACCDALDGAVLIDKGPHHHSTVYVPVAQGETARKALIEHFEHANREEKLRDLTCIPSRIEWVWHAERDETVAYTGLQLEVKHVPQVKQAIEAASDPKHERSILHAVVMDGAGGTELELLAEALAEKKPAVEAAPLMEEGPREAPPKFDAKKQWTNFHGSRWRNASSAQNR
ncbi:MAG: hypothetical protein V4735_07700 [Pseudomonadota bacterium]